MTILDRAALLWNRVRGINIWIKKRLYRSFRREQRR